MGKGIFKSIQNQDKSITPFKAYKSWGYETSGSIQFAGIDRLVAIKPNTNIFSGKRVTLDSNEVNADSGSFLVNISNDKPASVIWYSIDHLYYKRAGDPYNTFGNADHSAIHRSLYDEAFILSIPQSKIGEQIKPGSVKLYVKHKQNSDTAYLIDDGYGNLIDTALSSSISNQLLYLGFNNCKYDDNWASSISSASITRDKIDPVKVNTIIPDINVTSKHVWITPQFTIPTGSVQWGSSAYFYDKSYIRIPNNDFTNFKREDDFSIAFWTYRQSSTASTSYVLTKRSTGIGNILQKQGILSTKDVNYNNQQYPFEILYPASTGVFTCRQSNGDKTTELTGSINVGDTKHVVFQKTGSNLELYINGQKVGEKSVPTLGTTQNFADIFIGSLGINSNGDGINGMRGAIDEFFIFSKALTQSEVTQLAYTGSMNSMSTNTNVIGNVFYSHGLIVVSDPRPKYGRSGANMFNDALYNTVTSATGSSNLDSIYFEYSSTVTIQEHEYICKINEDEFNFTLNPTIRINDNMNSEIAKDFVYDDNFSPYITTIGLYSKKGELLAIGKLATPIKKRDNVDLNIIVRFDA